MSQTAPRVVGSVLDRLMDDDASRGGSAARADHAALRRDLEALLNARRPWAVPPNRLASLRGSIFGYGLPDFAAGAFNAPEQRLALCREIELAIGRFEPRLTGVSVRLLDRTDNMDPVLRVRIEGVLNRDTAAEPVGFDTLLDATTTDMIVRPIARAR